MITSFADSGTEDVFNGKDSKRARKACPNSIWNVAQRKLDQLDSVARLDELKIPRGNEFEELKGDRKGEYSIRINKQYRVTFRWAETGPHDVKIEDYH